MVTSDIDVGERVQTRKLFESSEDFSFVGEFINFNCGKSFSLIVQQFDCIFAIMTV